MANNYFNIIDVFVYFWTCKIVSFPESCSDSDISEDRSKWKGSLNGKAGNHNLKIYTP